MELYGESSLWLVDPRICPSSIGRMFFPMRSIPYDLFFVLLPMRPPHERLLHFSRRSTSGCSVPSWLTIPVPVYLKRHVRTSKTEPLVDEIELIGENSHYAHVRYPDTTVSTRHLAPCGEPTDHLPLLYRYSLDPHLRESRTHTPCLLQTP